MILEREIIRTTDSTESFDYVVAYYDDRFNLVISHGRTSTNHPEEEGCESARLSKNDAFELARRMRVAMTDLPAVIAEEFSCDAEQLTTDDINACFRDITDFILSRGLRYRMLFDNSPF